MSIVPDRDSLLETLRRLAAETVATHDDQSPSSISPDSRLVEDLGLDSIHLLSLAVAVEDHFRICLDADDEAALETVGDLVDVIARKMEPAT